MIRTVKYQCRTFDVEVKDHLGNSLIIYKDVPARTAEEARKTCLDNLTCIPTMTSLASAFASSARFAGQLQPVDSKNVRNEENNSLTILDNLMNRR